MYNALTFLKLGGSLITDKNTPSTPLLERITRIATEIAAARAQHPEMRLVLGHGSGSFGHVPAKKFHTRSGVKTAAEWSGFATVWAEARTLNHIVMQRLASAGLPVIAISPSSAIITNNGSIRSWNISPIERALQAGLIPVVYGDVIFDENLGGTILSTEELFYHLTGILLPDKIHIAGIESAVFLDYPENQQPIPEITPATYPGLMSKITHSASVDVTGGMAAKVDNLVQLVQQFPQLQAWIFSGVAPGSILQALVEVPESGTCVHI